ncbi:3-deoxy-D-manno-octulosonic acid kinase [Brackiella oedipodis]|uniref:3-deoxy-D-manno-octulosonic acid kinase n=1 Tax=Brackiella oedipodis TaxID=124225 RepID=UPI00048F4261|nr:3-deoxy-D-manno-octulosonic acid kinase [Brackiella oedipodis]
MKHQIFIQPHYGMLLHADWQVEPSPALFDVQHYPQAQAVGQGGRNAAWFIQTQQGAAVLRYFRRGGLLAKLIQRHYLWSGVEHCRAFREFAVLAYLHEQKVLVPKVLGAYYQKAWGWCQMALITEQVPKAQPIVVVLQQIQENSALYDLLARQTAITIHSMHKAGVWHADLNAYNLLFTASEHVYVIDFDKAKRYPTAVPASKAHQNLSRLQRSLVKVSGQKGELFWQKIHNFYSEIKPT